jgi:beta-galactosidase
MHWGVFVTTPQVSAEKAQVKIQTQITNETDNSDGWNTHLTTKIFDPTGNQVAEREHGDDIGPRAEDDMEQTFEIASPKLWSLDSPALYTAVSEVWVAGKIVDRTETKFGIREFHFDADTGFWLNGKNFKVKGAAVHEDGGAFGMAVPLGVWEQRLAELKKLGVNAIRTAHNPPAPEFLDLCDRMGFLVMDEMFDCWTVGKNPFDYHLYFDDWSQTDERDSILRDRNHPSIILYSVGNEIHDTPQADKAKKILSGLVAVAHEADPTRPVTQALFRPNASHDYDDGLADMLDVIGQNYRENEILAAHDQKPTRKIIGTENTHDRRQWTAMRDHAPYAGQFLWTGVDYLGESRRWPLVGHGSGLFDRTGAPRSIAFERQSWWSDKPMVFITRRLAPTDAMPTDPGYAADERYSQVLFADWTPKNLQPHNENVEVYSNCKEVELFLNGKSLGVKPINTDASPRNWQVSFAPGELKAEARDNGRIVATCELRTAGSPKNIVLSTGAKKLSPGWDNVAFVRAKIVDAKGIEVPRADDLISFQISGPGVIAAVDSANNLSHEPFQATERHAFEGECAAFVKATATSGKIKITASADGLESGSLTLQSR